MDTKKLETELSRCIKGWKAYEKDLIKHGLPGPLQPTAVGFKVAGLKQFKSAVNDLLDLSKQLYVGSVNDRFIGSFVFKKPLSGSGIRLIKVLQRRPGVDDPLGLDHVDFYVENIADVENCLTVAGANWERQSNDVHKWVSVRFGEDLEYEAKLFDHTVLSACIDEMKQAEDETLTKGK